MTTQAPEKTSDPSKIKGLEGTPTAHKNMKRFAYQPPSKLAGNRGLSPLVRSDILMAMVQTFEKGGEQELHSHSGMDGFWFVLRGRARFYGENNELFAEVGPHEGVFVPRNVPYWFESTGDEMLELLQVEATDKTVKNAYVKHSEGHHPLNFEVFSPEGKLLQIIEQK